MITSTLIISTYNWHKALDLCLKSVTHQTLIPNEVIIADDGSTDQTRLLIEKYIIKYTNINFKHIWHEDKGFRLAEIRNKAIKASNSDYIIQIDGDIILNKYFIEDHMFFSKKGCFIRGVRANLNSNLSELLLDKKRKSFGYLSRGLEIKENGIRVKKLAKVSTKESATFNNVLGCNMSFWKKDLIEVNGYDNNLMGWGHEDEELCSRLVNNGVNKLKLKYAAIQYHIYHKERDRESGFEHNSTIQDNVKNKTIICSNGLNEI